MADLVVHPLNVGDLELDSSFVNWQMGCGKAIWSPTTAWLITGAGKPILVDTSFRNVEDAGAQQGLVCKCSAEQTMEAQLAKHSLTCADIGYVIHTHLHMDHAGQDFLFPSARILVRSAQGTPERCCTQFLSSPFLRSCQCRAADRPIVAPD